MQRWSEYCSDLYNYELQPDLSILSATRDPPETDDSPPIQKSEVEAAVRSLKLGKAPGVANIASELLKAGHPQTEMHGDRKLILLLSDPPDDPTGRGTE
ncbi:hypothetical protein ElyMa_001573800 [Elysia marginata]|uniref:Uncharacterized protein n=1 Tax=Elysia marginata TaxID=1093978 RepID=A0AAV4JHR2_9GAST|nr:hypothetical protein ElyMa_001573800 [Elysia marginata]